MATVLVVEDDKLSQRILSKILGGAGHTVLLASSVEEAWSALRRQVWVDLVILDNQLGQNWGWRLLEELRQDVLYRDLPVVIYTGHTERSSILRYVELGVTSMLVKPYKAETIYDEVAKAVKVDWAAKLIEKPAAACARLQIKEPDYYSVLSAGASALEKNLDELKRALAPKHTGTPFLDLLQQIHDQSITLGMPALRSTADALAKAVASRNPKIVQNCLQTIDSLRLLLRNRALAYMGIGEVTTRSRPPQPVAIPKPKPEPVETAVENASDLFRRRLAAIPVLKLGASFGRLRGSRLFPPTEWDALSGPLLKRAPFSHFTAVARYIDEASTSAQMEDLASSIKAIPGFDQAFLEIARRLAAKTDPDIPEAEMGLAMDRLGMHKTVILIAGARLAPALRIPSPLDLEPLRAHTICSMLLAYDLARMLKLADEPLIAAAGVVHNIGSWLFALSEPGLYTIAIALADQARSSVDEAERQVFGRSHAEAGSRVLTQLGVPPVLRAAAECYAQPATAPKEHGAAVACVHFAHELAWTIAAQDTRLTTALQARLLVSNNPIWGVLQRSGVTLPMDPPEFVDVMLTAARTSAWITNLLLALEKD